MYTLYGGKGSGSAAVEAALEFTGARFRIVNAATWANDPGVDELRLVNPLLQSGLVFIAANCYAAVGISDYPERWTSATTKPAIEKVREGARARLHRYWEIFADQFPATPFLSGDAPGALDLLASVVSKWSGTRRHLARAKPKFLATVEKIERVPVIAAVYARHWEPARG